MSNEFISELRASIIISWSNISSLIVAGLLAEIIVTFLSNPPLLQLSDFEVKYQPFRSFIKPVSFMPK
ncbi:MAG: hypothetical protein QXF25_03100 [Candidatus Pacearchaeota archaeon]